MTYYEAAVCNVCAGTGTIAVVDNINQTGSMRFDQCGACSGTGFVRLDELNCGFLPRNTVIHYDTDGGTRS